MQRNVSRREFLGLCGQVLGAGVLAGCAREFATPTIVARPTHIRTPSTPTSPSPPPGQELAHIHSVDISDKEYSIQLLLLSLQGIVNREGTRALYLIFDERWDRRWLDFYTSEFGIPSAEMATPEEALASLREHVRGYTVFDYAVPETIDVATTIAGLERWLVVAPHLEGLVQELGFALMEDLRGRFRRWPRRKIYEWAYETLWPRCNKHMIGTLEGLPAWFRLDLSPFLREGDSVLVRVEDETPEDGFGAVIKHVVLLVDGRVAASFATGTVDELEYLWDADSSWLTRTGTVPIRSRVADASQYYIYHFEVHRGAQAHLFVMPFPGFRYRFRARAGSQTSWREIASSSQHQTIGLRVQPHIRDLLISEQAFAMTLSEFPEDEAERALRDRFFSEMEPLGRVFGWVMGGQFEGHHVEQASQHGLTVATSSWAPNYSLHRRVRATRPFVQRTSARNRPNLREKVYLTFFLSDGDALWCVSQAFVGLWDSDVRGRVPLGWELPEQLLEFAPGMLQYYYSNASESDCFIGSTSGDGYVFPDVFPAERLPDYLRRSNQQLEQLDMRAIQVLNNRPTSSETIRQYLDVMTYPYAFFEGYHTVNGGLLGGQGKAWLRIKHAIENAGITGATAASSKLAQQLRDIADRVPFRPLFIPIHVLVQDPESTQGRLDVVRYLSDNLDPDTFEILRPDVFGELAAIATASFERVTVSLHFNHTHQPFKLSPRSTDVRDLALAVAWFKLSGSSRFWDPGLMADVGGPVGDYLVGTGFYPPEQWQPEPTKGSIVWAGTSDSVATITVPPNHEWTYVHFEALPIDDDIEADVHVSGKLVDHIAFGEGWQVYSLRLR